jgi:hypothetical protein
MGLAFAIRKEVFDDSMPRWSYSGFNAFRRKLANQIGMNLDEMEGFTKAGEGRGWAGQDDAIVPFLDHSDCDGILTYDDCENVGPRLRELIKDWPDYEYDKIQGLLLADAMDLCAKNSWDLVFC